MVISFVALFVVSLSCLLAPLVLFFAVPQQSKNFAVLQQKTQPPLKKSYSAIAAKEGIVTFATMKSEATQPRNPLWKEKIQYACAVLLITSSIALAFIQALDMRDIANGVLMYIAQAFLLAGSIFGLDYYIKKLASDFKDKEIGVNK